MASSILAVGSGIFLSTMVFANGCAMNTEVEEHLGSQSAALTTDFFSGNGLVHIQVNTCAWSPVDPHPVANCSVNPGFVLVGGGAEVEGTANGGGLLTHSFPINKSTWTVASKDHMVSFPHRIRAYSVGMQLQGMPEATLRSLVTITQSTSALGHAPSATATIPHFHVMLSGGAVSNYQGQGQLLTGSFPSSDTTWAPSAKNHEVSNVATVPAFL